MNMLFARLAPALTLTITSLAAAEAPSKADVILPGCRAFVDRNAHDDPLLQGFCVGTVNGIAFATGTLCASASATATNDQLVRTVIAYIEARPARMSEPFERLAAEAIAAAWRCGPH